MADDHDMRSECAVQFAEIRKDIARVRNGHDEQAAALEKMANAMQTNAAINQRNHDETTRMITGFQGSLVEMFSRQGERVALVEQSDRAAHNRLDGIHRMLWGVIVLLLTIAAGVVATGLVG